jgi:cytoskeletal protein CcmA (bactofilin family)
MALWKDSPQPASSLSPAPSPAPSSTPAPVKEPVREHEKSNVASLTPDVRRKGVSDMKESLISSELAIEGKIVGAGHVRVAGRFKGDVHVEGNLTIEPGAHLDGQVRASTVVVGGELMGNIESAKRVELLEGGVINGDVKAGSLTVAAGSRMRGAVEFGWEEGAKKADIKGFGTNS